MKDTVIIFGRSLFINQVKNHIPELIQKYDSIGINNFYESYPDIKYVIFYDKNAAPKKKIDNIIVTDIKNKNEVNYQKYFELYEVITNRNEFSQDNKKLNFYYFTSSMAINFAYLKGYKNIILCGVDLMNNYHFDNPKHLPKIADGVQELTKKYMENVCSKYINIYQLNPESDLKLPKISMENLKGENK